MFVGNHVVRVLFMVAMTQLHQILTLATNDDGSCIPCIYGCTDSTAINYDSLATCNDTLFFRYWWLYGYNSA